MVDCIIEEEHSWIWHPFFGVYVEKGYCSHDFIFSCCPDLKTLPKYVDGVEEQIPYDPPRGYVIIDHINKKVSYIRYDQSKYNIAGSTDSVNVGELDKKVRIQFGVESHYKSVLHGTINWWYNIPSSAFDL